MDEAQAKKLGYVAYAVCLLLFIIYVTGPDLLFSARQSEAAAAPAAGGGRPDAGAAALEEVRSQLRQKSAELERVKGERDSLRDRLAASEGSAAAESPASGAAAAPRPRSGEAQEQVSARGYVTGTRIVAGRDHPIREGRYGDAEGQCWRNFTNNACAGTFDVPIRSNLAQGWPIPMSPELWRRALGERILAASQGMLTDEVCGGFFMWGDYVWCNRAVEPDSGAYYPRELQPEGTSVIGLSFGIKERDPWSELMSNRYGAATHLFDCYYGTRKDELDGPLGTGADPQRVTARNIAGSERCGERRNMRMGCYEKPYEAHRVCLSSRSGSEATVAVSNLHQLLEGRPPLSVHVKIDAEGSEWGVLADLVDNPEDCERIRTLDMEIHFSRDDVELKTSCDEPTLEKKVQTMERLAEIFVTTGSTFEALLQNLRRFENNTDKFFRCVSTDSGWSIDQYCISYTNRKLVNLRNQ